MTKMIALVTAASSGFGRVIAHALAGAGSVDYASMREWCVLMFGSYRISEVGQKPEIRRCRGRVCFALLSSGHSKSNIMRIRVGAEPCASIPHRHST
jgi:hypothetical protein